MPEEEKISKFFSIISFDLIIGPRNENILAKIILLILIPKIFPIKKNK